MNLQYRIRYIDYLLRQRMAGQYVFIHINKCGGTSVEKALGIPIKIHDTAERRRLKLGRRRWDEAFTFALIRHPYSRMISFYRYRLRYNQTGVRDAGIDLNAWLREVLANRNPAYYDLPRFFAPCFDWVSDRDGRIIVDHVAKLEAIDTEWPLIRQRLGEAVELPQRNVTRPDPGTQVLEPDTRRLIRERFRKDFEAFGYEP
jgi:hypothetical protein